MKPILLILLLTITASAQMKHSDFLKPTSMWQSRSMTIASSSVCFGGVSADLLTSRGIEINPLLRNSNGSPNLLRAGLIGFGACGSSYLIERRHPKAANILRFLIGGVHGFAAIHNARH